MIFEVKKDDTAKDTAKITFMGIYFSSCRFLVKEGLPIRPEVTIIRIGNEVKLKKKISIGTGRRGWICKQIYKSFYQKVTM